MTKPLFPVFSGVALAVVVALMAGCATSPAPPPPADSIHAALVQYEAMAKKLHSPQLVAKLLLKQAEQKQAPNQAIMAALLALRAGDRETAAKAAAFLRRAGPEKSETWSISLRVALAGADLATARKAAAKAYDLGGAQALAAGIGGLADPWFVYPLLMKLAQTHPGDGALQLVLARGALAADAPNAALTAAKAAHRFSPGARAAQLIEIQALWNLGRRRSALRQAAQALAGHAHDIGLRVFYANMLARSGERRRAREVLNDAHALAPDDARIAFGYAMIAADAGDSATARARLTAILGAGGDTSGVYNLLGDLAANENRWGEAFGWYQQIRSPDDLASSRVASLFALQHWKGSAAAEDYLTQLNENFPGLAPTWAGVHARILESDGKNEAAWTLLGKALDRYPRVRPLRYERALLGEQLGKAAAALASLRQLVKEAPSNPMYLNAYGYSLTEHTTRYRDAYGYVKRALAIVPNDGAVLDSMGWVLYRLGEPAKALGYLRRAWNQTGDIAVARHLVTVYLALNRRGEASKVLIAALKKSPSDPGLLRLKRQLAPQ